MSTRHIKFKNSSRIADGTMAFRFEKPAGFTYDAGQFAEWTLLDPPETDSEGNTRTFTLASAPFEKDLMLATRMHDSAFKRVLQDFQPGAELAFEGPHGSFTLHHDSNVPAVFLTGGIGVTPVRSILLQADHDQRAHPITMFLANHTPDDAPFLDDLTSAAEGSANYTVIPIMTQMEKANESWSGETGHITADMLRKYLPDLSAPIYYLTGPPGLIKTMWTMLTETGVNKDNIQMEAFPGY